ncbi:MAG: hypothetical protein ACLQUW_14120 [Desulfobaccales bacterium]
MPSMKGIRLGKERFLSLNSGKGTPNAISGLRQPGSPFSFGLAVILLFAALARLANTKADPDLWGYLAFGRLFWTSGHFPYQDLFSFTPTLSRWVYHEWLTGVVFYPIYRAFGFAGLQLLKIGLGLVTLGLVYLTARRLRADVPATIIGLFISLGFLTMGYSPVRAQEFTYAFYALTLYLLETARQTGRWRVLWLLAPLQILWCNLHGGFVAGLGLVSLYALGEALSSRPFWPYAGILLISVLATLLNPYGWEYWQYVIHAVVMPRPQITEWASVLEAYRAGTDQGRLLYLISVVGIFGFLAWWARWRDLTAILVVGITLYLGIRHTRHLVFFLLLTGAYLPVMLTRFLEKITSDPKLISAGKRLGWKAPAIAGLVIITSFGIKIGRCHPLSLEIPPLPEKASVADIYYPVGAVEYIKSQRLKGNLLTEFDWGEYLIWILSPQCKVALDGRYETVYPEEVTDQYFDFIDGRKNWREFLQKYPPEMVLIKSQGKAYGLIHADQQWRQVYFDRGCALFVRNES